MIIKWCLVLQKLSLGNFTQILPINILCITSKLNKKEIIMIDFTVYLLTALTVNNSAAIFVFH